MRKQVLTATAAFFDSLPPPKFIPNKTYIAATAKCIDSNDLQQLVDSCLDLWFSEGRFNKNFETALAQYLNSPLNALSVNSGSSANLLALSALKKFCQNDDEVITTACGFPTTVNPIFQNQLTPVFVDIELTTLNVNLDQLYNARTKKTKAVVLAHTLGNPLAIAEVRQWCDREKLFLIEDCCDALGASYQNKKIGTFGDFATFSFYPAHQITMGEGGAIICADSNLRKTVKSLRDWGRDCWCPTGHDNTCHKRFDWNFESLPRGYDHKYIYTHLGYNLKITDMQAALGLSQLNKIDQFTAQRKKNRDYLYQQISRTPKLSNAFSLVEALPQSQPSWFGFALTCKPSIDRQALVKFLESRKIATRLVFAGNIIKQPAYQNLKFKVASDLTITDQVLQQTFWVGVHPLLNQPELDYILENLDEFLSK